MIKHISEILPEVLNNIKIIEPMKVSDKINLKSENKMIADFMGYPGNKKNEPYYYAMKHAYDNDNMRYHDSWDWLIPVYNRILKMLAERKDLQESLKENFIVQWSTKNFFVCFENQIHINSCYLKIVDFIQWYNQKKQAA